jgi:hypothetical protein
VSGPLPESQGRRWKKKELVCYVKGVMRRIWGIIRYAEVRMVLMLKENMGNWWGL